MIKKLLLSTCMLSSLALAASTEEEFHSFMQRHRHHTSMNMRIKSFIAQTAAAFSIHYLTQFATKQLRNRIITDKGFYLHAIAAWLAAHWTLDTQDAIAHAYYEHSPSISAHALGAIGSLFCQSPDTLWSKWNTGHPWGRGRRVGT